MVTMLRVSTFLSVFSLNILNISLLSAHPGMTDSQGCHTNWATGGYHCHGSRPPSGFGLLDVILFLILLFALLFIAVLVKHYFDAWYETSTDAGRLRAARRNAGEAELRKREAQKAKEYEQWKANRQNLEANKRYRPWKRRRRKFTKRDQRD